VIKEAHLLKEKCMKQETASKNIKNPLKSSTENKEIEEQVNG
jgi:hypothetical protein